MSSADDDDDSFCRVLVARTVTGPAYDVSVTLMLDEPSTGASTHLDVGLVYNVRDRLNFDFVLFRLTERRTHPSANYIRYSTI